MHVEAAAGRRRHQIERREQPAEKCDLSRGRAGGLHDIILPAVVALGEQAEREKAEERGDDRDVRPEAELEHDVWVGSADQQRDAEPDDDRAWRELSNLGRLLQGRRWHVPSSVSAARYLRGERYACRVVE